MNRELFAEHLTYPQGQGIADDLLYRGSAGGAACGDEIEVAIATDGHQISRICFEASGCGAMVAAGSAVVALVQEQPLLAAGRVGVREISAELGGLSPGKLHAAELVGDALHRALGVAVRAQGQLPMISKRTLVAMSGGVDSAVALLLEQQADREVVAVTLELWADEENDAEQSCCSASAVRSARSLAHRLDLPHFTLDLREEFKAGVVDPYLQDHQAGLTPNPCVRCNGNVRLDAMLDYADRLGAATLTTGHYAQVSPENLLRLAVDSNKDQTYMLAALAPKSIARMRFPLGSFTKPQVREIAARERLPVAAKPESQDLCFLAGTDRKRFLARHSDQYDEEGKILTREGDFVGTHHGYRHYTIGQRKGLGIGGGTPYYVLAINSQTNAVTVGERSELATRTVRLVGVLLHQVQENVTHVKLRYRSQALACELKDSILHLHEDAYGVAPGQIACLLAGDDIVGWGTIRRG